ncbi:MAG: eight-cysteine-cluster domain-containing protein [Candidatus Aenigmatarchaeota archaeon]
MNSQNLKYLIMLILVLAYILSIYTIDKLIGEKKNIKYEVSECEDFGKYLNYYYFDEKNNTIIANIVVNCCSDEIIISEEKDYYKILEIEKDGKICRCLCNKIIKIFNAEKNKKILFISYSKEEIVLEKEFCGISTYSYCNSNFDCKIGGCSGEICGNVSDEKISICIWKQCYENLKNYKCLCADNKCQWIAT